MMNHRTYAKPRSNDVQVGSKSRCGFTLTELLVVISFITLLAGILLPALGKKLETETTARIEFGDKNTSDPNQTTGSTKSSPALPDPGNFYALDWEVSQATQTSYAQGPSSAQATSEQIDFGALGTSQVALQPGNTFGDFTGSLLLENVAGDLLVTSSSTNGFVSLDLFELDPPIGPTSFGPENHLENQIPFLTSGSMLIPANELIDKTLADVFPIFTPLFFEKEQGVVPLLLTNDGQHVTNLIDLEAKKISSVPEPSTFVLLSIGGIALIGFARRRKRKLA